MVAPTRLQRFGRTFSWNTLLAANKPPPILVAAIPLGASVRSILRSLGIEITLPVRPLMLVSGTLILVVAWVLVRALVPPTIVATQDRALLTKRGGLPHLWSLLEVDIGAYAKTLPSRDVLLTLESLLPTKTVPGGAPANLGAVLAALGASNQVDFGRAMTASNALFAHVRKGWQVALGTLFLVGYGLLTFSYGMAVWQLLA